MVPRMQCPNCLTGLQPLRKSQDFFCRACFTSLVVIDERWVQMMRANDKIPQNIPFAALMGETRQEAGAMTPEQRGLTGPLPVA